MHFPVPLGIKRIVLLTIKQTVEITIADGSVVEGDVIVRDPKRKVKVILSGGGKVLGEIENAEIVERDS